MPVNYIICAAGEGSRFKQAFPGLPKPLIKLYDRFLLDWSLDSLPIFADDRIIIITQKNQDVKAKAFKHLQARFHFNQCHWLEIDKLTSGQLETAFQAKDLVDFNSSTVIFNCDTYFQSKTLADLINNSDAEGIIPSAQVPGDAWSFCKVDNQDQVTAIAEKKRISDWASVGLYFFRDTKLFFERTGKYLGEKHQGETYVAPFYELYLQAGQKLVIDRVSLFKPMGTPEQIKDYWQLDINQLAQAMNKKTLVMDLDNTITIEDGQLSYPDKKPNSAVIKKMHEYKAKGYEIIVYTARRMRTYKNDEAKVLANIAEITITWLKQYNVPFDGLRFGKPFAENGFYVDDRAIRPDEFLKLTEEEIFTVTTNYGD